MHGTNVKKKRDLIFVTFVYKNCTVLLVLILQRDLLIAVFHTQVCVYADDIVLVTRTKQALINTFQKLKQEAIKYGLVINQNETKYMRH